jgi:hypothetical protein
MAQPTNEPSSFIIIADSHGKNLDPIITQSNYHINTHVISGLQWVNSYNKRLCVRSLLLQSPLNTLLSSCNGVLFIIGTNAVRAMVATDIIEQVKEVIGLVREHHPHLNNLFGITIADTFPCLKLSNRFSSISSLMDNIKTYNDLVHALSVQLKFSYFNLCITENHLGLDHMHVHPQHKSFISNSIINYFDDLFIKKQLVSRSKSRSTEATTKRNRKRHAKFQIKLRQFTLSRPIHSLWKLNILKEFLNHHHVSYARLPEVHHHIVRIQFKNLLQKAHAEQILSTDVFNEHNFHQWTQTHS